MREEDANAVWRAQRRLRELLIDTPASISYGPARDLAAHMLLFIEDGDRVWDIARSWLRKRIEVDMADGGFVSEHDSHFYCTAAIDNPAGASAPRALVYNGETAMQRMWQSDVPLFIASVAEEQGFTPGLRRAFEEMGARSKLMSRLHDGHAAFGLVSLGQGVGGAGWRNWQLDVFETVVKEVLAPVLATVHRLAAVRAPALAGLTERLSLLTRAEARVARLAAAGLSYKEIARQLDRSPHTVDHQLRQVRQKLGIATHSRLVRYLVSGEAQAGTGTR